MSSTGNSHTRSPTPCFRSYFLIFKRVQLILSAGWLNSSGLCHTLNGDNSVADWPKGKVICHRNSGKASAPKSFGPRCTTRLRWYQLCLSVYVVNAYSGTEHSIRILSNACKFRSPQQTLSNRGRPEFGFYVLLLRKSLRAKRGRVNQRSYRKILAPGGTSPRIFTNGFSGSLDCDAIKRIAATATGNANTIAEMCAHVNTFARGATLVCMGQIWQQNHWIQEKSSPSTSPRFLNQIPKELEQVLPYRACWYIPQYRSRRSTALSVSFHLRNVGFCRVHGKNFHRKSSSIASQ